MRLVIAIIHLAPIISIIPKSVFAHSHSYSLCLSPAAYVCVLGCRKRDVIMRWNFVISTENEPAKMQVISKIHSSSKMFTLVPNSSAIEWMEMAAHVLGNSATRQLFVAWRTIFNLNVGHLHVYQITRWQQQPHRRPHTQLTVTQYICCAFICSISSEHIG